MGLSLVMWMVVIPLALGQGRLTPERRLISVLAVGVGGLLAILFLCRLATASVRIDEQGVVVRNVLRSRRVPWSQIARFGVLPLGYLTIGYVELHDGREIRAWGLQGPMPEKPVDNVWTSAPTDELNAILAGHGPARRGWTSRAIGLDG